MGRYRRTAWNGRPLRDRSRGEPRLHPHVQQGHRLPRPAPAGRYADRDHLILEEDSLTRSRMHPDVRGIRIVLTALFALVVLSQAVALAGPARSTQKHTYSRPGFNIPLAMVSCS